MCKILKFNHKKNNIINVDFYSIKLFIDLSKKMDCNQLKEEWCKEFADFLEMKNRQRVYVVEPPKKRVDHFEIRRYAE